MKLLVFLLGALAASGAASTFGREYYSAYFARSSELAAFEVLATGEGVPDVPFSSRSMREIFETCGSIQQSFLYSFQLPDIQDAVDGNCAELARRALQRAPTYAGAHTVLMMSSKTPADIAGALMLSQLTAPRESWHIKLRLRKGLTLYGTGLPTVDRALEADIAFMVQTGDGRRWLARFYDTEPELRTNIAAIVALSPNDEKAAFLKEVTQLGQD